jgi:hypothetical protein
VDSDKRIISRRKKGPSCAEPSSERGVTSL